MEAAFSGSERQATQSQRRLLTISLSSLVKRMVGSKAMRQQAKQRLGSAVPALEHLEDRCTLWFSEQAGNSLGEIVV
jgi:hypothetical protein